MNYPIKDLTVALLASYRRHGGINHLDGANLPSRAGVVAITLVMVGISGVVGGLIGIPLGVAVIASCFVLSGIYVWFANGHFDDLNARLLQEVGHE